MKKLTTYIFLMAAFCNCSEELNTSGFSEEEMEITGVEAFVAERSSMTRAEENMKYLEDYISRYAFVNTDKLTFTKIERASSALNAFSYRDVEFQCNASGAWERNKNTGHTVAMPNEHPERIYWSDATSPHTFVGYSLPKDNNAFNWWKSEEKGTENSGMAADVVYYYGAIGDPTNDSDIDYDIDHDKPTKENISLPDGKTMEIEYSQKMRDEDLLLTYTNNLVADNSVAKVYARHALSSVRVKVSISGFYGSEVDIYSTVSDMMLLEQPVVYRWKQNDATVEALTSVIPNNVWGKSDTGKGNGSSNTNNTNTPAYDKKKNIKLWNYYPKGNGDGAQKEFLFYGITVPQNETYYNHNNDKQLKLKFKVTYPDPLKNPPGQTPTKYQEKEYVATISEHVYFYPGKCTTINITLNHKDESMTVGAEYMDWQYISTPDNSELKKNVTMLTSQMLNRNNFYLFGEEKANVDDATWLYVNPITKEIVDIYGNNGKTIETAFQISTAQQLVAFAHEVKGTNRPSVTYKDGNEEKTLDANGGFDFNGYYVQLDANIILQPELFAAEEKQVEWVGIGDQTHSFNGIFLGENRTIRNLKGQPFFYSLGEKAVVEKLTFSEVIEVSGFGIVANKNDGMVCGVYADGTIRQANPRNTSTERYSGTIVGRNKGWIISCAHVGDIEAYATGEGAIGGLVGYNESSGAVIACYHSGIEKNLASDNNNYHTYAGVGKYDTNSIAYSSYFNSEAEEEKSDYERLTAGILCFPRTMAQMQSKVFVDSENELFENTKENLPEGQTGEERWWQKHNSLNHAIDVFIEKIKAYSGASGEGISTANNDLPSALENTDRIQWLKNNEAAVNSFKYTFIPGTYPKIK